MKTEISFDPFQFEPLIRRTVMATLEAIGRERPASRQEDSEHLLTRKQAAKRLAISERQLAKLQSEGAIPRVTIGRSVRIDVKDLAEYIERCKANDA